MDNRDGRRTMDILSRSGGLPLRSNVGSFDFTVRTAIGEICCESCLSFYCSSDRYEAFETVEDCNG